MQIIKDFVGVVLILRRTIVILDSRRLHGLEIGKSAARLLKLLLMAGNSVAVTING